jgi:hypothetical protein
MRRLAILLVFAAAAVFAADHELLKLVMPDARIVSGVNLVQVKKSRFGQFALAQFSASQDQAFDGFVKASGFDPRYHLDEIVVASPGSGGNLVVARGTFDTARILEVARSVGAEVSAYQGVDVIASGRAGSRQGGFSCVAFLSGSIAIAGDPDNVRAAIGRRQAGTGPGREIAAKVDAVSAASDAWFVSTLPVSELLLGLPGANLGDALKGDALGSIQQASGGAVFGDGMKFRAELVTASAQDASGLVDFVRLLPELITVGPQGWQPEALDLKTEGNILKLGLAIPEAQLESLIRQPDK